MKYLIVGLGNIGGEYAETRHNIGFKVLDALLSRASDAVFTPQRYGDVARMKNKGRELVLLKPSTYMNLSGKAVRYWMQAEKIEADHVFVVVDDVALPFGQIRIRKSGSDGGHNGLAHVNEMLGHQNYARLRFGIGGDFPKGFQVDYVLGQWSGEEKEQLPELLKYAGDAVLSFAMVGIDRTMNFFNVKKEKKQKQTPEGAE